LLGSILVVAGLYLVIWGQNEDCCSVLRSTKLRLVPDGQPGVNTPPSLEESLLQYVFPSLFIFLYSQILDLNTVPVEEQFALL
jgi:hypothetical protein